MPQLEVWIASAASSARMDDADWRVDIYDESGAAFIWAAQSFTGLAAPQSRWSGAIPPGTYQVEAHGSGGRATHRAFALVSPLVDTSVTLLPRHPEHLAPRCDITVERVVGVAPSGRLSAIAVHGTSEDCRSIVVTAARDDGKSTGKAVKAAASTKADGAWMVTVPTRGGGLTCGDTVVVVASCREADCSATWRGTLQCPPATPRDRSSGRAAPRRT